MRNWSSDRRLHLGDISSQAHGAAASSTGVQAPGSNLVDVRQELGFTDAGVPHQQDIQLTPDLPTREVLRKTQISLNACD